MTGPLAAACNGYSLLVARLRRLAPFFIYLYIYIYNNNIYNNGGGGCRDLLVIRRL